MNDRFLGKAYPVALRIHHVYEPVVSNDLHQVYLVVHDLALRVINLLKFWMVLYCRLVL